MYYCSTSLVVNCPRFPTVKLMPRLHALIVAALASLLVPTLASTSPPLATAHQSQTTSTSLKAPTPLPSNQRILQMLSSLDYLPLAFVSSSPVTASPYLTPGHYKWRWPVPPALTHLWSPSASSEIEGAAIMTFDNLHNIPPTTTPSTRFITALLSDVNAHHLAPQAYDYVYVSTSRPERTYLYVNGRLAFSTLANTGVASAPTELTSSPVYLRYTTTTMQGTYPWGGHYYDTGIPWVSYFLRGEALHGFIRPGYGYPQSLGCVEMPFAAAHTIWEHSPIGTIVTVSLERP